MLSIEISKSKEVPGIYSCYLKFSEFNQSWIEIIRNFHTRKYHAEDKIWEFPFYQLQSIIERYQNVSIQIHFKKEPHCEYTPVPEIDLKRPLFEHQKIAVEYGINNPKYLLLDTMGLGKTTSVIAEAIALKKLGKITQCLIICCVSDLQYNWEREIKTVCNESCFILGTRYKKNGKPYSAKVSDRVDDLKTHKEFFLITNKETLQNDKFIKILTNGYKTIPSYINFLAIDEFHKGCFLAGTKVATSSGYKNIEDIVPNKDKVVSFNKVLNQFQFRTVTKVYKNNNICPIIELKVTTNNGEKTIHCTEDHLIYTLNRGYVKAMDLTESDEISEWNECYCKYCGKQIPFYRKRSKSTFCNSKCANLYRRKTISDFMKNNNPNYIEGVCDKRVRTRRLNNNYTNNFLYGNGKISPAELVALNVLTPLGFKFNKSILTKSIRKIYPNRKFAYSYKPDFVLENKCIEIDGNNHLNNFTKELDNKKEDALNLLGYTVKRYTNNFVIENTELFLKEVKLWLNL